MTKTHAPEALRWRAPSATGPIRAAVALPGSKSMTARALLLSAAADGASTVDGGLSARDTALMAAGLTALGVDVDDSADEWRVSGRPLRGPASVDCGLAGTVMRFLPPLAATADGAIAFDGDPHARTRPMGPLLRALTALGVTVEAPTASLPFTLLGTGRVAGGEVTIDASTSSQLVSGLLLAGARYERGLTVRHSGPPVPSAPHIRMTVDMLRAAGVDVDDSAPNVWRVAPGPVTARGWVVEPDLSNAAPFLAAALVTGGRVTVPGWPASTRQPGDRLRGLLSDLGAAVELDRDGLTVTGTGAIDGIDVDLSEVGELTPVVAALCALADGPSRLRGVRHLRGHETDRIHALATELGRLGAHVSEEDDGLTIRPRPLRGAVVETYADHRMAQAAAVLGLAVPGVDLSDVACTSKTLPEFPDMWTTMLEADH